MRNVTEQFSPENNFWDYNQEFKVVSPFKELFNSDKSRNKKTSSNIMWAIALCYHPKSSLFNLKDKEVRVFDMVKDKTFKLSDYKEHVKEFLDMCLSQGERSMVTWEDYMKGRDAYLSSTRYYFDEYAKDDDGENMWTKGGNFVTIRGTADQLDKAWLASKAMWAEYFKIKKELNVEDQEAKGKGGRNLSLSDSGEI